MSPNVPQHPVQRVRRALSSTVNRMPTRAQYWSREAAQRIEPLARRVWKSPLASPLVSIVVPVYNVETYLPACLDSILGQTYRRLQVIAVDDGSPDRSIDILRRYAAQDSRLEIVRQTNAGLGAARNNGVPYARGRFLMFLDSDDVLLRDAVATYVRSLRRSGSDFAVGSYQRVNAAGTAPAAWWIREAHRRTRLATTLAEFPDILVNAVAWSKVYRRSFWVKTGLRFPEGVLYEDQVVSARAYARARTFDVVTKVTHQWRIRDDRTSITQQHVEVADLRARLEAAFSSLAELSIDGLGEAHDVRLAQLLSNDFPLSIRAAQYADDDFWQILNDGLTRLTDGAGPGVWDRVAAQHRLSIRLVADGHREAAVEFVGLGHNNPKHSPAEISDAKVYVQFPARETLRLDRCDPLLALAPHQIGLVGSIRQVVWRPDGRLQLGGWAYLDNVDLSDTRPVITLLLTDLDHPDRPPVSVPTTPAPLSEVTVASTHRYADYENSGFTAIVDPAVLGTGHAAGRWSVGVFVEAHGISRTGVWTGLQRNGSAGRLLGRVSGDRQVALSYNGTDGLVLSVTRPSCLLSSVELTERRLAVEVEITDDFRPLSLEITGESSRKRVRAAVSATQHGATASVVLPPTPAGAATGADGASARSGREVWLVRLVGADGRRVPIGVRRPGDLPTSTDSPRLRLTGAGNLGVVDSAPRLLLDAISTSADALVVSGRVLAVSDALWADGVEVGVSAPRGSVSARTVVGPDGRFEATIALLADPWGLGERPLSSGTYRLTARQPVRVADPELAGAELANPELAGPAVGAPIGIEVGDSLLAELPLQLRADRLRGEVQLTRKGLQLVLSPPLTDSERGARPQQVLRDRLAARRDDGVFEPGAVLFRSYFGEICGCNPLAVHEELRRRRTGHTLYWAVTDHSVAVPEGGIAVLHESAEWYRLLHEAQYYMDNMHQQIYHRKPPHQVQIQTFHGYPFKQMGLSHWRFQNRDVAHIRSYLDRAADWDYLVSPASYGTELLRTEFGCPNEMLAIGYPRNDVLQSPQAEDIRSTVRARLGIGATQTAVLYGPTFRDELSKNDFAASMVDFLDVERLAGLLGPDYVVMVRGHAFNARVAARLGSRGNVLDVTDYPSISDLCLASDAAVLDYSSLRFDYALTTKPMIFMVPDLELYLSQSRGALFPFEPTAPGPLVSTTDEVAAALSDLDGVRSRYAEAYRLFREQFLDLDDGHAAERLVDRVFDH